MVSGLMTTGRDMVTSERTLFMEGERPVNGCGEDVSFRWPDSGLRRRVGMGVGRRPTNHLQIEHEDCVKHGHDQKGDERGHGEPANLRVAEGLPEGPAVGCEGEEGDDGRPHRDGDGSKVSDARIDERIAEGLALFVFLFDEIEQHDDVADDDANQADDAEEGHESKGSVNITEEGSSRGTGDAVGDCGENQEGSHCTLELHDECNKDCRDGDGQHDDEVAKSLLLLFFLTTNLNV